MRRLVRAHGPVLLMLVFLGTLYVATLDSHGMFVWDEAEYASLARSVLRGEGFTISGVSNSLRPPVLPLAAAASMWALRSEGDVVLKVANVVFGLLAIVVVWSATRREYGDLSGIAAAGLLGIFPAFWRSTSFLMTEIPFMAFFTAAVIGFYGGLYRDPRLFYVSWLAWGLALLTRYTAVLFGPLALLFVALAWMGRDPDVARRLRSPHLVLGAAVGAVVVSPWLIRQHLAFGDALIGFKQASTQLQAFLPGISEPWYFYPVQIPTMVSWMPTAMLGLGAWWAARARDRFALHCLLVCAGMLAWFSCYRFKEIRQVTSVLPFMAILAALGATKVVMPRVATRRAAAAMVALFAVLLAVTGVHARQQVTGTVALGYPSFSHAMNFLRRNASPDAVLVGANHPQIHWYTDRRVIDFPEERDLRPALERSEWVVVTNFERGQRSYARRLLATVTRADVEAGNATVFRDRRFFTALIRSSVLQERW